MHNPEVRKPKAVSIFGPMLPTVGGRITHALTVLLFLAIAAVSSVLCWALPRQDRLARERASRLLTAEGTVDSTEVRTAGRRRAGHTLKLWTVQTSYTFEVDKRPVNGSRFSLDESSRERSFSLEDKAEALRARYPEGARVTVWYDPRDPRDSGLDPSWTPVAGYALPAAAVATLSLLVAVLGARSTLREARQQPLSPEVIVRALESVRFASAVVAAGAALLLAIHGVPIVFHDLVVAPRLATAEVWTRGDLDVDGYPPTPVVSYYFRAEGDPALLDGASWRFGRQAVRTLEEAEAVKARLRDDFLASRIRVHYSRRDPGQSALSPEHGGVLPYGLVFAGCVVLLLAAPVVVFATRALRARHASARKSRTVP
jgi:hypothetical protein